MAIVFELVVDCGPDAHAAHAVADWFNGKDLAVRTGDHLIDFHPPYLSQGRSGDAIFHQVSLIPRGVGYGVGLDRGSRRVPLNTAQLSDLGRRLYEFLRGAPGYRVAAVGWDPEGLAAWEELRDERQNDLMDGTCDGVVVHHDLVMQLPSASHFVPFDPDHLWIPYRGTRSLD